MNPAPVNTVSYKRTIAVDFDGVLHGYSKKWHDGTIYDDPIPGSREAMGRLLDLDYEVAIYSTRCHTRTVNGISQGHQLDEMAAWLFKHHIPFTRIHDLPEKPLCVLFIDDNAYRFKGDWLNELPEIEKLLKPHTKKVSSVAQEIYDHLLKMPPAHFNTEALKYLETKIEETVQKRLRQSYGVG